MNKLLLIIVASICLSGCAELQVIGTAAFKEFKSEAINVEMASYQPRSVEPAMEPQKEIYMAKADLNPFKMPTTGQLAARQNGLWEGR